ncbi:MAG: Ti-type conjugative transfer relaxase TraA, partial [Pseudomonadota bacterium]|nr:Ti-type conjugative transfer relaxase TraA [Pseudomonadota bacterium]
YAGRDELKDMKTLAASLGRSGAKETVLDYTDAFAARRGLGEGRDLRSEIVLGPTTQWHDAQRAADRPAAHYGALGERVRSPSDQQPFAETARAESGESVKSESGVGPVVPPLVPVITRYDRTIEEVARAEAARHLDHALDGVRSVGPRVFVDPKPFAALVARVITERNGNVSALAEAVAERPEVFGQLRGKTGLLGENRERKEARRVAGALSAHVKYAGQHWTRRYEQAASSEQWKREKQDVIEVPGLSPRSEALLKQFDTLAYADKPAFLEKLVGTPEGKRALEEAEVVTDAMRRRCGTDELRHKDLVKLTRGLAEKVDLVRVAEVAEIAYRARAAEITREYDLVRRQTKGLGLGWRRLNRF